MKSVYHADIKRRAHLISRHDSEQTWNPFRHLSWDQNPPKRQGTWPGRELEEQRPEEQDEQDEQEAPIQHTQSEPAQGVLHHKHSAADSMAGFNKETDVSPTTVPDSWSRKESGELIHESQQSTGPPVNGNGKEADANAGLRNRKQEAIPKKGKEIPRNSEDKPKEKKKTGFLKHVQPKTPFTVANQLQRTFLNSWINLLLIAAPVGIALNYIHSVDRVVVFVVNFIAIIPLAAMLSFATEEIALRTGETIGGLLNATFGNAVELIVAILALVDGQEVIVQTSLIGSILSNLLLVLGFCFFFGGLRRTEQHFNTTVAQTAASLLALAVASVIVPSVFERTSDTDKATSKKSVADLSRGTSIILLIVYGAYLFFQLKTHQAVFSETSKKNPAKPWSSHKPISHGLALPGGVLAHGVSGEDERKRVSKMMMEPPPLADADEDEEEEPRLHFFVALATLGCVTAVIALCAEFMVHSIGAVTAGGKVSAEFVGLILLPIVGNAAEHATAVTVAIKDKMDLAIGVAVGSSMQVALFLIPLLVIIGWAMGNDDMNLSFDLFQVATLFVSVLLANYLISDGKSHWLEGLQLICLYFIIAVCSWFYIDPELSSGNNRGH